MEKRHIFWFDFEGKSYTGFYYFTEDGSLQIEKVWTEYERVNKKGHFEKVRLPVWPGRETKQRPLILAAALEEAEAAAAKKNENSDCREIRVDVYKDAARGAWVAEGVKPDGQRGTWGGGFGSPHHALKWIKARLPGLTAYVYRADGSYRGTVDL